MIAVGETLTRSRCTLVSKKSLYHLETRKNTEKHNICIETKFVLEQNVVN